MTNYIPTVCAASTTSSHGVRFPSPVVHLTYQAADGHVGFDIDSAGRGVAAWLLASSVIWDGTERAPWRMEKGNDPYLSVRGDWLEKTFHAIDRHSNGSLQDSPPAFGSAQLPLTHELPIAQRGWWLHDLPSFGKVATAHWP